MTAQRLLVDADDDVFEYFFAEGLTDGLPIVPPSPERVRRMLRGTERSPSEIIAQVPPSFAAADVELIAINAVMAGCAPEYLPTVIAGVEAISEEQFCLHGIQGTTGPASPLLILNGPIRHRLHVNCGFNVFGEGWRANSTIGRALRLIMVNVGGSKPGEVSKSTQGHPGKYTYCIGEYEEESPWEPFHVEAGFAREESTITAFAGESPIAINDHYSRTSDQLVASLGFSMATIRNHKDYPLPTETVLVVGPEHAKTLDEGGLTKPQLRERLFEQVRRPLRELRPGWDGGEGFGMRFGHNWVPYEGDGELTDETLIPKFPSPDSIIVVVAGGTAGRFSSAVASWVGFEKGSNIVTKRIEEGSTNI